MSSFPLRGGFLLVSLILCVSIALAQDSSGKGTGTGKQTSVDSTGSKIQLSDGDKASINSTDSKIQLSDPSSLKDQVSNPANLHAASDVEDQKTLTYKADNKSESLARINDAQGSFLSQRTTIHTIDAKGSMTFNGDYVPAQDLQKAVDTGRQNLLNALNGDDFAGMRNYIQAKFETRPQVKTTIQVQGWGACVNKGEANNVLNFIDEIYKIVKENGLLIVDLNVKSSPEGAVVTFNAGNITVRQATANMPIRMHRGLYRYTAKLKNKDASGELNLVENPGATFDCELNGQGLQCRQLQ